MFFCSNSLEKKLDSFLVCSGIFPGSLVVTLVSKWRTKNMKVIHQKSMPGS